MQHVNGPDLEMYFLLEGRARCHLQPHQCINKTTVADLMNPIHWYEIDGSSEGIMGINLKMKLASNLF